MPIEAFIERLRGGVQPDGEGRTSSQESRINEQIQVRSALVAGREQLGVVKTSRPPEREGPGPRLVEVAQCVPPSAGSWISASSSTSRASGAGGEEKQTVIQVKRSRSGRRRKAAHLTQAQAYPPLLEEGDKVNDRPVPRRNSPTPRSASSPEAHRGGDRRRREG